MPEYTVILAGRLGVGKSSLFRRLSSDTFVTEPETMRGDSGLENYVYHTTLNGEDIAVRSVRTPLRVAADALQALVVQCRRWCVSEKDA